MYTNLASAVFFVPGMAVGLLVAGLVPKSSFYKTLNQSIVTMCSSAIYWIRDAYKLFMGGCVSPENFENMISR